MRVVAGVYRGMRLDAPPGRNTRPITDRVKESIFNILTGRFGAPGPMPDVRVMDLFAGAGSFGIECLSRGASSCLFVERDRVALSTLRGNIARLRDASTQVVVGNAWTMRLPKVEGGFGVVFLDPPYRDAHDWPRVLGLLERVSPRLSDDGLAVFRHEAEAPFIAEELAGLSVVEQRIFGAMGVWLLRRRGPETAE
ncbi:MAG: 16S rRNA (guanine(966)-N(2))-methyltransferase RsmD [Phycisphaerales bacterium]|nr:16S rRNA (guanine(966)-N(2))-methyltransferase RsmD [Phycisphaerales bacterium]